MAVDKRSVNRVLANLNKTILNINGRTQAGLVNAGLLVVEKAIPLTPKDEGLLRNRYYTRNIVHKNRPAVEIGNTAEYAMVQHENLEFRHTQGEAKFLEKAITRNASKIVDIISSRLKV